MLANDDFSAAEAAVYDRQMRLWGVEAQKRLQSSCVLISGLSALGSELAKNLVLSGMNVTVQDEATVTKTVVETQFFFSEKDVGQNRAKAGLSKIQELNPLVRVQYESRPLDQLPDEYIQAFSAVCLIGASQADELRFNELARTYNISFFCAHSIGFDGIMFADLGKHTFRRTPIGDNAAPSDQITVEFPSLAMSQEISWSMLQSTRKRGPQIPRVFVKHELLRRYRSTRCIKTFHSKESNQLITDFIQFAHSQLEHQQLPRDFFSVEELTTLIHVSEVDLIPICAILAGVLGQEVIKAISQKDDPICNYFCYDGNTGVVRRIG